MNTISGQKELNIYFAGAIRGGRDDAEFYSFLIQYLKQYGRVLTEHVGNETLLQKERSLSEEEIFRRDMGWMQEADLMIAEVSTPSLGVGYELAIAEKLKIPTLCLFHKKREQRLSAMISGNPYYQLMEYSDRKEAEKIIDGMMQAFTKTIPSPPSL